MPPPPLVLGARGGMIPSDIIGRYAGSSRVNGCMPILYAAESPIDMRSAVKGLPPHSVMWCMTGGSSIRDCLDRNLKEWGVPRIYCYILDGPDPGVALEDVLAEMDDARGRFTIWGVSGFSAEQCHRITEICASHDITRPSVFVGHPSHDIVRWARIHGISMWIPDPDAMLNPMLTDYDRIIVDTERFDHAADIWMANSGLKRTL